MRMFAFVVITTFLVVGINSLVLNDSNYKENYDRWEQQCRQEMADSRPSNQSNPFDDERQLWCAIACVLEKGGAIKDGQLNRDRMIYIYTKAFSGNQPMRDGRAVGEVAESCYNEVNTKADKCEVAGNMRDCLYQAMEIRTGA